jgi:parvulin-like peptidyl-prolyl isomerase
LRVGQISPKPIQIENRWFIVRVRYVRPFVLSSFEKAKPLIAQALVKEKHQKAINELLKKAKIVRTP